VREPPDVTGNAVHVVRIATGEIETPVPDNGKDKAGSDAFIHETRSSGQVGHLMPCALHQQVPSDFLPRGHTTGLHKP
jgi:hypothetical protein